MIFIQLQSQSPYLHNVLSARLKGLLKKPYRKAQRLKALLILRRLRHR